MNNEQQLKLLLKFDRSRRFWRLLVFVAIIVGALLYAGGEFSRKEHSPHVARVDIEGMIFTSHERDQLLREMAHDEMVKAVLVHIDSPGGTMVGGIGLYEALRAIGTKKPVVITMGTMAASAGYLAALGGDHIIANPATLSASVGVFLPLLDATKLAEKVGIKAEDITSGDMKAVTSPLQERNPEAMVYLKNMVNDLNALFMDYVTQRRQLDESTIELISDGRAMTGTKALRHNLIDALGGYSEAREWLADTHKISYDVPVVYKEIDGDESFLNELLAHKSLWPDFIKSQHVAGAWSLLY